MKTLSMNGLLVNSETNQLVGYVSLDADGHYCDGSEKLESIPANVAQYHNELISKSDVANVGTIPVGGWGCLYFDGLNVVTFGGDVVSSTPEISGASVVFDFNAAKFEGRLLAGKPHFNFKRTA